MAKRVEQRRRDSVTWVAEQLTVSIHDFIRVLNAHPSTQKQLNYAAGWQEAKRLEQAGLLATKKIHRSLPKYLYVTKQALNELHLPFPEYEPRTLEKQEIVNKITGKKRSVLLGKAIHHTDAINKARLYFETVMNYSGWRSERWIRQDERQDDSLKWKHRIDAYAIVEGKEVSIEVENTNKAAHRLEKILVHHLMNFDQTIYFCTNTATYSLIHRKVKELDPELDHFQIISPQAFMQ